MCIPNFLVFHLATSHQHVYSKLFGLSLGYTSSTCVFQTFWSFTWLHLINMCIPNLLVFHLVTYSVYVCKNIFLGHRWVIHDINSPLFGDPKSLISFWKFSLLVILTFKKKNKSCWSWTSDEILESEWSTYFHRLDYCCLYLYRIYSDSLFHYYTL